MVLRVVPAMNQTDRAWLARLWEREWGGGIVVSRGRVHQLPKLDALVAWDGSERVGAVVYDRVPDGWEVVSLNALKEGSGVGTALLEALEEAARSSGQARIWLISTNDNLEALRFYQRRGYRLVAVYPGAVDSARGLKPGIPLIGKHGIPVHDEIELEKRLTAEEAVDVS